MTKNKIIKGLIRGYGCDDEDDCILSCNDCIHQKFLDYEKQIRADAIDEFIEKLPFSFDGKISESTVHHIAEQLKENKNDIKRF